MSFARILLALLNCLANFSAQSFFQSCSADEDDLSCSPLICKRSWETFESDYKFLMEEDIIGTCQVSLLRL